MRTNSNPMRALLLEGIPADCDIRKSQSPETVVIAGEDVYASSVIRALLQYGTYDSYLFVNKYLDRGPSLLQAPIFDGVRERISLVDLDELKRLNAIDELILMTPRSNMSVFAPLRASYRRSDWPVVGFIHSLHSPSFTNDLASILLSGCSTNDALVCSSKAGRTVVENLKLWVQEAFGINEKIKDALAFQLPVIPLGVACSEIATRKKEKARRDMNLPADKVVVLYLGRFSLLTKCDLVPLLLAFREVILPGNDKAILVLAGDDTLFHLAPFFRDAAATMGLQDAVILYPNPTHSNKLNLLAAADLFVSPSDNTQETFGIAIAEAMAAGLAVIASDWSGYRELVKHGETGFLIPTYWDQFANDVDILGRIDGSLAAATVVDIEATISYLRTLVSNPDLCQRMGNAGKIEAFRRFDWQQVIKQYEELWSSLLEMGRIAKQSAGNSIGYNWPSYSYMKLFGHYPTQMLDRHDVVSLTQRGCRLIATGLPTNLPSGHPNAFDPELIADTMDSIRREGVATIESLVNIVNSRSGATPSSIRHHIARLLKYGVLEVRRDFRRRN